jgi:hypothetical protein
MASPAVAEPEVGTPPAAEVAPAAPAASEWVDDPRLAPPALSAPSSEAVPPSDPPVGAPAGEGDAPKPVADAKTEIPVDWKAKLEAGDADFLAEFENHPKVKSFIAGRAGFLLQQQREAETKAARDAELDRAAEADPASPLAQARLAERQAAIAAEQQAALWGTAIGNVQAGIKAFMDGLPEAERAAVSQATSKAYGELTPPVYAAYMADLTQSLIDARLPALKAAWEKETLPGLRKEVQAELLGNEPSPDLGVGASLGKPGALTQEKVDSMTPAQWSKWIAVPANKAAYNAYTATLGQAA